MSGLSETGVSAIGYDDASKKLFVAYNNSNVPDIKRSATSGDKNIYAIYPDNIRCYLCTGLGVAVLDAEKYEVKDTWFIGAGGRSGRRKSRGKNRLRKQIIRLVFTRWFFVRTHRLFLRISYQKRAGFTAVCAYLVQPFFHKKEVSKT